MAAKIQDGRNEIQFFDILSGTNNSNLQQPVFYSAKSCHYSAYFGVMFNVDKKTLH